MKPKELAARLHCADLSDFPTGIDRDARRSGLVVVMGVRTDTVEFHGAIEATIELLEGGTIHFDADGVLPAPDDVPEAEQQAYYDRKRLAASVDAEWQKDGFQWTFTMVPPHSRFVVQKDGERYCRGIVFSLADTGVAE